jgi:carbonic anhydrase
MCNTCKTDGISRRSLIAGGIALGLSSTLATQSVAEEVWPVSPEMAMKRLIDGNARYQVNAPINGDYSADRANRSLGQKPFAAIVSCSDSRVAPELIFDESPGALFVVRVAGNFLNEDGLASIEFGCAILGIQQIVVLGHTGCGAISATISSIEDRALPPGHLPSLVNAIRPAVYDAMDAGADDLLTAATETNARRNAEWVVQQGPILAPLVTAGTLKATAAVYDISNGKVRFL